MTYDGVLIARFRPVLQIQPNKMLCQPSVAVLVDLVQDKVKQIETRDEGRREVDVGRDRQSRVVFRVDGIGGCEDGGSCIEGGDDTSFGDGYRLLFLLNEQ